MLAFGRNILLWLSFSLLLMHSLVPHHHNDHHDCQDTHVSKATDFQNPISYFLQTQLGEGHLEHFLSEDQRPSTSFVFVVTNNQVGIHFAEFHFVEKELFGTHKNSFCYTCLESPNSLRGPPSLS